jgi:ATP-dependent RNA helicase DeaD
MDMRDERRVLARGAHIVAATPGRLRDHIMRGSIDLSGVRAVVLDEADEMLDLGFREELEYILGEAPEARQTLLFSATVPAAIATLAKSYQKDAARIVAKSEETQHADIDYRAMMVADRDIDNAVINTLRFHEAPNALVFANTRAMVNRLATRLSNRGFQAVALSGELSQSERTHALQAMRDGRAQVCVATDVAARGIDLPKLDLVVHAELPSNHETLLHRSGRTGRAGRKGVSALIVTGKTRKKAERILAGAKVKATWGSAPSAAEVRARDEERLFSDPSWHETIAEDELGTIERLVSTFAPEQIAAAFLRQMRTLRAPPEELSEAAAKPAPRKEFGPSVWFSVSGGRDAGAEPRRLLPMLCKAGDLTKDDIGAIRVQQTESFVQIREASVAGFLGAVGEAMVVDRGVTLSRLDGAPSLERPERSGPKPAHKPPYKPPYKPASKPKEKSGYPKKQPTGDGAKPPAVEARDKPVAEQRDAPVREGRDKPAAAARDKPLRAGKPAAGTRKPYPKPKGAPVKGGDKPPRRNADTSVRATKPGEKPKGPPPPTGKPSSKKNRTRAQAAGKPRAAGKRPGSTGKKPNRP